jgi:hypothetical protein
MTHSLVAHRLPAIFALFFSFVLAVAQSPSSAQTPGVSFHRTAEVETDGGAQPSLHVSPSGAIRPAAVEGLNSNAVPSGRRPCSSPRSPRGCRHAGGAAVVAAQTEAILAFLGFADRHP